MGNFPAVLQTDGSLSSIYSAAVDGRVGCLGDGNAVLSFSLAWAIPGDTQASHGAFPGD